MGVNETKNIIDKLKQGDSNTLQKIYIENREIFLNYCKKHNIGLEDSSDIYQDAILVLRENAINNKIDGLKSSISTYLFAIGKFKMFHKFREKSKLNITDDIQIVEKNFDFDVNLYEDKLTNKQRLLQKGFKKLGKRCQKILKLFYFEGYTLDEIKDILEYSDKKVLKSQKSRCIKQLKEIINK